MADTMGDTKNYQVNRALGAAEEGGFAAVPGLDDVAVVYCTYPALEAAKAAGKALVEQRLAACVNIIPGMTAIYEWEGAVHEDGEVIAIVKTVAARVGGVFAAIKAGHPYANPALLEIDVRGGFPAYLAWVKAQVGTRERGGGEM